MTKVKSLALSGVFAGLALALMWMISFIPSMDYALPAAAGMLTLLLVLELGSAWGTGLYLAAGVLSVFLLPNKGVALLYVLFFGYYPIIKTLLEQHFPLWLAWLCKLLVFNAAIVLAYWLAVQVFGIELEDFSPTFGKYAKAIMLGIGNLAFLVYDYMIMSTFTMLYQKRWRRKLRRLMGRD